MQPPHPPFSFPAYRSSVLRGPTEPLVDLENSDSAPGVENLPGLAGRFRPGELDHDLTLNARRGGEPIGERVIVSGRVLDRTGSPVPGALVEVWQANAAGRYLHKADNHAAPLDPNFAGAGRSLTDRDGAYRFSTIMPGAYPWQNHHNAWRPRHIHFSVIGASFTARLVTQMYFPGDPLLEYDPIFKSVPAAARSRLVARFDPGLTQPEFALGYQFDIVLGCVGAGAGAGAELPGDRKGEPE